MNLHTCQHRFFTPLAKNLLITISPLGTSLNQDDAEQMRRLYSRGISPLANHNCPPLEDVSVHLCSICWHGLPFKESSCVFILKGWMWKCILVFPSGYHISSSDNHGSSKWTTNFKWEMQVNSEIYIHLTQINNNNDYGNSVIYFSSHSFHHSPSESEVCIHCIW